MNNYNNQLKSAVYINQYFNEIEKGNIKVNKLMNLTIKRIKRYLNEYEYNHNEVERRIQFIENECSNTKGDNSLLKLALIQKVYLSVAYGFFKTIEIEKINPDTLKKNVVKEKRRLINEIPIITSRGSGKTTLASAISLVAMMIDGEHGADVNCLAQTREQSNLLFNSSRSMTDKKGTVLKNLKEKNILRSTKQGLLYEPTNSLMSIKTSDYEVLDGLNSHAVIFDEMHSYKDDFIKVVKDGSSRKRKNWQMWYISTNGTLRDYTFDKYFNLWVDILNDKIDIDNICPFIHQLDDVKEIYDEDMWQKAIPMLDITIERQSIRNDLEIAKSDTTQQAELMTKTFGLTAGNYQAYFTVEECQGNKENYKKELFKSDEYKRCILGIDLSDVNDFCSFTICVLDDDYKYFKYFNFVPRQSLDKISQARKNKYLEWEQKGELIIHDLDYNSPDYLFEFIHSYLEENKFLPTAVAIDRWGAKQIIEKFKDYYGDIVELIGQSTKVLSNPLKIYKSELISGKLIFDNSLVSWCHGNVKVKIDANGNIYPNKAKAGDKIDPVMSGLNIYAYLYNNADVIENEKLYKE